MSQDDESAKEAVGALVTRLGYAGIDVGGLVEGAKMHAPRNGPLIIRTSSNVNPHPCPAPMSSTPRSLAFPFPLPPGDDAVRQFIFDRFGEPAEVLRLVTNAHVPEPAAGEVSIRITKRLLHPGNVALIRGTYPVPMPPGGMSLGVDGVGTVTATGEGVDASAGLTPGTRVAFFPGTGAWNEVAAVPANCVFPIPDDIPDDLACVSLANTVAALLMLRAIEKAAPGRAGVTTPILLTAAGSSFARALITLALRRQLRLIGAVRSRTGADALSERFPGLPIVTTEDAGWREEARTLSDGEPCEVIVDPVGGALVTDLLGLLADGGTLVLYGGLAEEPISVPSLHVVFRGITLRGVSSARWLADTTREQSLTDVADVWELLRTAPGTFPVAGEFDLADLAAAVELLEKPGSVGGVILRSDTDAAH
ncbi:zinc-binding dehydrogenase [Streptomyces sp. NPDC046870]|uniref:zinc-binding dehydrogenase n=1 Tax=Streptomyces sp. NPDC046870 TaxID=3155135 RepID=UPI003452004E